MLPSLKALMNYLNAKTQLQKNPRLSWFGHDFIFRSARGVTYGGVDV